MRARTLLSFVLLALGSNAQFPLVRSLEIRPGQERPAIDRLVQDQRHLLWLSSGSTLLRTDGDQVEVMTRREGDPLLTIAAAGHGVIAGTALGLLLRCGDDGCDTLTTDSTLRIAPISSIAVTNSGVIWIGTYGNGLAVFRQGGLQWFGVKEGLPDGHVNDLVVLPDDRLIAATDQGLVVINGDRVTETFGEAQGAPDNLTLCLALGDSGMVWAGTDRSGVFGWRPGDAFPRRPASGWTFGQVRCLATSPGMVWAGTKAFGPIAIDLRLAQGTYRQEVLAHEVQDLFTDADGAVWWCDGSEWIRRADPAILFVPEHEGLDLRHITALCADDQGSIWFATAEGLHEHVAFFSEERKVGRAAISVDPRAPIVSLAAGSDGTIWAGTFGKGVVAVHKDGSTQRYTVRDGLANDNVLAVRRDGSRMLFATLEGASSFDGRSFQRIATEGFVFDVMAGKGTVHLATDGTGIREVPDRARGGRPDQRTFYALVKDGSERIWSAGPGTGFCLVGSCDTCCFATELSPFDGDLFAVGAVSDHLLAFGSTGVLAFDPITHRCNEIAASFGLEGITAELNAVATDASGALWFGCSRGLVRLRPGAQHFRSELHTSILQVRIDGELVPLSERLSSPHDHNTAIIRFTAPHFANPGAVRFEYRLIGLDDGVIATRDREVTFGGLRPGDYTFQVRAFIGASADTDASWTELRLTIEPPWWRKPWVIIIAIILAMSIAYLLIRARDRRIRYREGLEKEKVRFQLDALRSQVDPHFLFNSFNALMELIESDPQKAVGHVEQLSTFFRNILHVRDRERIGVEEELGLLENYFALEQRRFGEQIALRVHVDERARSRGIVPLTLQMLVENALKHNVVVGEGVFEIEVRSEGDVLIVSNPLRPRSSPPRSTGFGLHSIITRYAALTDHPIDAQKGDGRFIVRIPLIDLAP